jgi:signal transduction histidine kinase
MAGRLSHELRTPVAVVRSSLDNLRAAPLADEARVYVDRANEGVGRLARLIARLSEATRLERALENAEPERFDLRAVVAGCVEGYRTAYAPRPLTLEADGGPAWMEGVPDAIAQLLDKLVENANDFAPAGTAIRVALRLRDRRAALSVENDGPNIPAEALPRLFASMTSLREARDDGSAHLGLGLYIVRLVAEHHGATVRVENLDAGVRFSVEGLAL